MYCMECNFWHRDGGDGICRKNSPRPEIMPSTAIYTIVWPRLGPNEPACGDFKRIQLEEQSETQRSYT